MVRYTPRWTRCAAGCSCSIRPSPLPCCAGRSPADIDPEIAEAVLRYYTRKKDPSDVNRDKTDLVATFLYRHSRVPGNGSAAALGWTARFRFAFEIALIEIMADADVPSFSEEHVQLLRHFDPLQRNPWAAAT